MGEFVHLLFGIYSLILSVYWVSKLCGTPPWHPLAQSLALMVEPLTRFIRPVAPLVSGRIDTAVIVLFVLFALIDYMILAQQQPANIPLTLAGLLVIWLSKALSVIFWCVIASTIASWFPTLQSSPLIEFTNSISEPILGSLRRFIPTAGILDFSAMVLLLGIHYLQVYSLGPLAVRLINGS